MTEASYQDFARETELESDEYMFSGEESIRQFVVSVKKRAEVFMDGCEDSQKEKYDAKIKKHITGLATKLTLAESNFFVVK